MPRSLRRPMAALVTGISVLVVVALGFVVTDQAAFAVTRGVSMNPVYYQGDLVVIAKASSYDVGQIVAYQRPGHPEVVLHRIVGGDAGGYVFRGDNNHSIDPTRPTQSQLVGRAVLHIPQGGAWLDRLTSPTGLGVIAFGLLAGGGTVTQTRRRNRRRTMSQHVQRTRPALTVGMLSPNLSTSALVAAVLGIVGVGLGIVAWTGPTERAVTDEIPSDRVVEFSYAADVPPSPAYDGTIVHSPDPVFRALADAVDVNYSYEGEPGTVSVTAELSSASGWHSTIPLGAATTFRTDRFEDSISLDLPTLMRRAERAAAVIGIPADQVTVTVRPRFVTDAGAVFAPELPLSLSASQLAPVDPSSLTVKDIATITTSTTAPRTLGLLGHDVTVATARKASIVLFALALLIATLVAGLARLGAPSTEGAAIRRRHASILVRVEPMPTPSGRPVIDVSEFATLVKLAERYGLLVLHWSRSDVETFVVQDESTTYRYRAAADPTQDASSADGFGALEEHDLPRAGTRGAGL